MKLGLCGGMLDVPRFHWVSEIGPLGLGQGSTASEVSRRQCCSAFRRVLEFTAATPPEGPIPVTSRLALRSDTRSVPMSNQTVTPIIDSHDQPQVQRPDT